MQILMPVLLSVSLIWSFTGSPVLSEGSIRFEKAVAILRPLPVALADAPLSGETSYDVVRNAANALAVLRSTYLENSKALDAQVNADQKFDLPWVGYREPIYKCLPLSAEFGGREMHLRLASQLINQFVYALGHPDATYRQFDQTLQAMDQLRGNYGVAMRSDDTLKANEWNSSCVGVLDIEKEWRINPQYQPPVFTKTSTDAPMVLGRISAGYADQLEAVLRDLPSYFKTLTIGNGWGGDVEEAMQAGRIIRDLGMRTMLSGECVSACTIMFLAGEMRFADQKPGWRLGFHQISDARGVAVPADADIYQALSAYFVEMGHDPNIILQAMNKAGPDTMYFMPLSEICDNRILYTVDCLAQ